MQGIFKQPYIRRRHSINCREQKRILEYMILELNKVGDEAGMEMNFKKTEILETPPNYIMLTARKKVTEEEKIVYSDQLIIGKSNAE